MKPVAHPHASSAVPTALAPPAPPATARAPSRSTAPAIGDASAWIASAVAQFEGPLVQYCTRLLKGDVDRARDVVQDAFLKLWTADRATIESHLGQWLYRVCRNRALDVRRKEHRMTALQEEQLNIRSEGAGSETPNTPDVFAMLDTLNETQAEALRLKFQGGLSYKEIAAVLDITANHVGVIIHNAIKALRERAAATPDAVPSTIINSIPPKIRGEA